MSSVQKIKLLVIPDLFPKFEGDVQGIFVLDYLRAVETFCDIDVLFLRLTGKKGLHTERIGEASIHRYCVSSKKIPDWLKPFAYMRWFSKGYKLGKEFKGATLIHAHGSILSGTLAYMLSKKLGVPFIISEHQGPFSMTSNSFWKLHWTRFVMQKTNAVLTVSNYLKEEIQASNIHPKKIIVTHNPVDTELFKLKVNNKATHNILFVGRLDEFKGALRCTKAFESIITKNPQHILTIVGDGEEYLPIKKYIEANTQLSTRIILKGSLNKVQIALQMQEADFFVFPSRHESFGLVIAEALSCGLPVIASNQTAPKEFVNQNNGLLVPSDDIPAIAHAMQQLINTFTSYNAAVIRKQIVANFGFIAFGEKLKVIYKEV